MNTEKDMSKKTSEEQKATETCAEQHQKDSATHIAADDLTEQLQQCKGSLAEWQEKYARLTADLENFKKRTMKERSAWAESAQVPLLLKLLSIVDNFDRAMEHSVQIPDGLKSWADGIAMIHTSLKEFLHNAGVKEVPYEQFNPEYHEALIQVDTESKKAGDIVEVMEKGYLLNDRVLRPAKVSVAK